MTEQQRVLVAVGLCLAIMTVWQALQPPLPEQTQTANNTDATSQNNENRRPTQGVTQSATRPKRDATSRVQQHEAGIQDVIEPKSYVLHNERLRFKVANGDLRLTQLDLVDYHEQAIENDDQAKTLGAKRVPVSLMGTSPTGERYQASIEWHTGERVALDFEGPCTVQGCSLRGTTGDGLVVVASVAPHGEELYGLAFDLQIENTGTSTAVVGADVALAITVPKKKGGFGARPVQYSGICKLQEGMERQDVGDLKDEAFLPQQSAQWVGIDRQYFVVVAYPKEQNNRDRCRLTAHGQTIRGNFRLAEESIAKGASWKRSVVVYAGPKRTADLDAVSPVLTELVDYNIWGIPLGFLARPMISLLNVFSAWTGSWGFAIILLTVVVKLLLFPITFKSAVSMRKMQMLKPELDKIKERCADDREKQQMEQLKLYKERGVNPLGGCLPMLLQMPVWFALYRALWTAVDLYEQPFLWLPNLTAKEPGLPFIALAVGAVFIVQQSVTPMAVDNQQAKIMRWLMPVMFTFFMFALPSGLVLYILVNSILSILQQLAINRTVGSAPGASQTPPRSVGQPGKRGSRLMRAAQQGSK